MKDIVQYHKEGYLTWKVSPSKKVKVGSIVGSKCRGAYFGFGYQGKKYTLHRVIWELHNGPIPKGLFIDHINRDKYDNRIENLRLATPTENSTNSTRETTRNCYWVEHAKAYQVRVQFKGKLYFGGYFKSLKDAQTRAECLRKEYHGEYSQCIA